MDEKWKEIKLWSTRREHDDDQIERYIVVAVYVFQLKKECHDSKCNEMNIIDCYMPLEQTKIARKIKWWLFEDEHVTVYVTR